MAVVLATTDPKCIFGLPWEVFRSVSTLAQSVMSVAVVAILATSAPAAHICSRVVSRALSLGVPSKLCEDRMILVSIGTAPPPAMVHIKVQVNMSVEVSQQQHSNVVCAQASSGVKSEQDPCMHD